MIATSTASSPDGDSLIDLSFVHPRARIIRITLWCALHVNSRPNLAAARHGGPQPIVSGPCQLVMYEGVVGLGRYGIRHGFSRCAVAGAQLGPPEPDPVAIRACLSPRLVAEFDAEWESALEEAKTSKDLAGVRTLPHKWRHLAYAEIRDPGSYLRLLAKAEQILRTGKNPTAGSFEDMQTLLRERPDR